MKSCCIIQGDVRPGLNLILEECGRHFNFTILSTWKDEQNKLPAGKYEVVLNEKPPCSGFTNRNFQRVSTAAGLRAAASLGSTHVLKWRTDLLPTRLNLTELMLLSEERPALGFSSRIVMSAFRNLSVEPDWFSSLPDIFAFGEIELMKLLWDDDGFDFSREFNMPAEMINECKIKLVGGNPSEIVIDGLTFRATHAFDAHVEIYSHFKSRLQRKLHRVFTHSEIAANLFRLINHERLGICWFTRGGNRRFRSIKQAPYLPWWTESLWRKGQHQTLNMADYGWALPGPRGLLEQVMNRYAVYRETALQNLWYMRYQLLKVRPGLV